VNNGIGIRTQIFYSDDQLISRMIDLFASIYNIVSVIRTVKRNPCPCSYSQASSDFRFRNMNSENRFEKSNNISCFVPSAAFVQQTSSAPSYQQVNIFAKKKRNCCFMFFVHFIYYLDMLL
jgi:hypothetical protein